MAEFFMRMFTPSKSDQSGMVEPKSTPAKKKVIAPGQAGVPKKKTQTRFAGAFAGTGLNMFKDQADTVKKALLGQ